MYWQILSIGDFYVNITLIQNAIVSVDINKKALPEVRAKLHFYQ